MNAPYSCSRVTSPELYNLISGKDKNLFFAPCLDQLWSQPTSCLLVLDEKISVFWDVVEICLVNIYDITLHHWASLLKQ